VRGSSRSGSFLLLLLLGTLTFTLARADEVILKNGGAIQGRIVSEDEQKVVVETKAGKVTIERARIREVVRSQARPQPETSPPVAPTPDPAAPFTLLVFGFDGADRRLITEVTRRVTTALGPRLRITPIAERPKPDERDLIDKRAEHLPAMARSLQVDPTGSPEQLAARLRAALQADPRPEVRQYEAVLDDICRPRLAVARLEAQAAASAGERLRDPSVLGVVGVTGRDISTPELNFLFGHADRGLRAGVVSYLRFADPTFDVVAHRAAVQLLSTTGVLLGLGRCEDVTCARAYPKNLAEHDRKQEQFCAACRRVVDAALAPR
jgi:predicted Zn-dependent protease